MSSVSGWQDPICYQFSFYAITRESACDALMNAYCEFAREMEPYYAQWIAFGGRILSRIHRPVNGYLMNELHDEDGLHQHFDQLMKLPADVLDEIEVSPVPSKTPRQFAASARVLDKQWKEDAVRFTDLKQIGSIDKEEQLEWLERLMNCPSDDLRRLCFPKKCFMSGSIPFSMQYQSMDAAGTLAYAAETLQESGVLLKAGDSGKNWFIHRLSISLPRYLLDNMGQTFSFQDAWKERLIQLAGMFETCVGSIKMDCYTDGRCHPLRTGCGNFKLGFSKRIHDLGWGICLTQNQVQLLGGLEAIQNSQVFSCVERLQNGGAYLQLTPDVSVVPQEKTRALWKLISPYIDLVEYGMNSMGNVPPSMRLGVPRESLDLDGLGQYRIVKP